MSDDRYSGNPGRFGEQRGDVRMLSISIPDDVAERLEELQENSDVNYDDAHYSEYTYQNSMLAEYCLDILKNHVREQQEVDE